MTDVTPLSLEEQRLIAQREKWREERAARRAASANGHHRAADAPPLDGTVVPSMPAGLSATRRWVRKVQDLYAQRKVTSAELTECRRSASTVADLYRAGADLRKAEAAIRAAEAQEKMADILASVEHGGAAVALLARLREMPGETRALPFRRATPLPKPEGA